MQFKLKSDFKPTGDQPQAIDKLLKGLRKNLSHQVLLGVTGSGKTFTIANVIEKIQKPTLVISHNKTLAGQLYQEFRDFFPQNAVSFFVSYYDYYQPEAYLPATDTYIEKEADINEEIDKLRLQTTTNLMTRKDVVVVASVSCIYNIGSPKEYGNYTVVLKTGKKCPRQELFLKLAKLQYDRSDHDLKRGTYRAKGDVIDLWPAYQNNVLRIQVFGDRLEKLEWLDSVSLSPSRTEKSDVKEYVVYPAKHYMVDPSAQDKAFLEIRKDLKDRLKQFKRQGKVFEAHRLDQRVNYDLEMLSELGYVNGVENYSRYFDGRKPGEPPYSLLNYFDEAAQKDWLLVIDESHMTIPQIRGMYKGDYSRKQTLIDYGFRLPSALDNRPLRFDEFSRRVNRSIYVSATPNEWEISKAEGRLVEQLIRPTGLADPFVEIKSTEGQIEDLSKEISKCRKKGQRVLVTTLTKRLAEALTEYLNENYYPDRLEKTDPGSEDAKESNKIKVAYLHSDVATLDRQDILDDLRLGVYDVLVGINLLREGLDLPEVSLVAILDADKEGFLRSKTSLIQTMGRAARHIDGKVIMYADKITNSMKEAIAEVSRRRKVQLAFNKKHKVKPQSIIKTVRKKLVEREKESEGKNDFSLKLTPKGKEINLSKIPLDDYTPEDKLLLIKRLKKAMFQFARNLEFEKAAEVRDKIEELDR